MLTMFFSIGQPCSPKNSLVHKIITEASSAPTKQLGFRTTPRVLLAFRFVLRISGKYASTRSGSKQDPDCGMEYGGLKRAWSFFEEFPRKESFVPTFPHRLNCTSRVDSIPGCFQLLAVQTYTNMVGPGKLAQESKRLTLSTFISTRSVLDPTTGFVSCGVKKC